VFLFFLFLESWRRQFIARYSFLQRPFSFQVKHAYWRGSKSLWGRFPKSFLTFPPAVKIFSLKDGCGAMPHFSALRFSGQLWRSLFFDFSYFLGFPACSIFSPLFAMTIPVSLSVLVLT